MTPASKFNALNYLMLLLILNSCNPILKQELYILPEKYKGVVVVVYEQPAGIDTGIKNDKEIYEIPPSGVLFIKANAIYGRTKPMIFYMKRGAGTSQLNYITGKSEIKNDTSLFVFSYSSVKYTKEYGLKPVPYSIFFVGNKDEYDSLTELKYHINLDSIINPKDSLTNQ